MITLAIHLGSHTPNPTPPPPHTHTHALSYIQAVSVRLNINLVLWNLISVIFLNDQLLNQGENEEQSADDSEFSSLDGALLQEHVTILNARLDQRSSEYDELKREFNRTKEECINLQGIKHGLQSRMSEQEQVLMKLKAELLKLSFSHQAANSDKGELQKLLEERDREIALLRTELTSKHSQLVEQKKKLDSALIRASDVSSIEVSLFFLHAIGRLLIIACT